MKKKDATPRKDTRDYSAFYALLKLMGADADDKESLVYGASRGRTCSLRELTDTEYNELVKAMNSEKRKVNSEKPQDKNTTDELRHLRSSVLRALELLDVKVTNGDWTAVNTYLADKRISGKKLYELTTDELRTLGRKLMSIVTKKNTLRQSSATTLRQSSATALRQGSAPPKAQAQALVPVHLQVNTELHALLAHQAMTTTVWN